MSAKDGKARPSLLGQALKKYRSAHKITQEELAEDLSVDVRTIRRYESGEGTVENIRDLRHISDLLGIEPESLGLAASIYVPKSPEQIEEIIERAWSLMHEVRIEEARDIIAKLLQDLTIQIRTEDYALLRVFALAYQVAGYIESMSARTSEVPQAIYYYHEMESLARLINDQTLLNVALAYQGDMYRRLGDIKKAIHFLHEAKETTPRADPAAMGNAIQLLGRAYLLTGDMINFERALGKAGELASTIDPAANTIHGHFNLGTVYEEYTKSYASIGQTQKALDYVKLAKAVLPPTENNRILLLINQAEALIYGKEIDAGLPLAIEAANISRRQGHYRRLERIQGMRRFLNQQALKFGEAELELSEALEGPMERWNINV